MWKVSGSGVYMTFRTCFPSSFRAHFSWQLQGERQLRGKAEPWLEKQARSGGCGNTGNTTREGADMGREGSRRQNSAFSEGKSTKKLFKINNKMRGDNKSAKACSGAQGRQYKTSHRLLSEPVLTNCIWRLKCYQQIHCKKAGMSQLCLLAQIIHTSFRKKL